MELLTGNYKDVFEQQVTELIDQKEPDRDTRMNQIEELTEKYMIQVPRDKRYPKNERPDTRQLERLANFILKDEFEDARKHKKGYDEFPFLTPRQTDRRLEKEIPLSNLATESGEQLISTSGVDYGTRKKLSIQDQMNRDWQPIKKQIHARIYGVEDEFIKAANNERMRKERESRKAGEVKVYYLKTQ